MALDYTVIGERLKKARSEQNITQEKLAEKLNVSIAFISRIECGSTQINLKRLTQICNILNIDEGQILNGTETESKKYLSNDLNSIIQSLNSENQKMLYEFAKIIKKYEDQK